MHQIEFETLLRSRPLKPLDPERIKKLVRFYGLVLEENTVQNLTRLLSPEEFYEGHVEDVLYLEENGAISWPCLDLGSGLGSPGLIYAILFGGNWLLCDSEAHKATFMDRAVEYLGLKDVKVFRGRAEEYLSTHPFGSVIAKAVGPVGRIYSWIRLCSTWNKLILLKGPKWEEEWDAFTASSGKKNLFIKKISLYEVGLEKKQRVIVELERK